MVISLHSPPDSSFDSPRYQNPTFLQSCLLIENAQRLQPYDVGVAQSSPHFPLLSPHPLGFCRRCIPNKPIRGFGGVSQMWRWSVANSSSPLLLSAQSSPSIIPWIHGCPYQPINSVVFMEDNHRILQVREENNKMIPCEKWNRESHIANPGGKKT